MSDGRQFITRRGSSTQYAEALPSGGVGFSLHSALPTADADNRGVPMRTEGGTGVADSVGIPLKTMADTHVMHYPMLSTTGNFRKTVVDTGGAFATPIVLTESQHTIDVPVASGDRELTAAMRDNIRGFAMDYSSKSRGVIQIMVPHGSANAGAASILRKDIRATLVGAGVARNRIIETSYGANPEGDAAPIRLAFVAITAKTNPCGQWPEDLISNTVENNQYHNFGCATQANLAAQIANPMDLVAPRGMSPIDAERRSVVIEDYRSDGMGDL